MEAWLRGEMERADVDTDVYLPYLMEFLEDGGAFDCDGAADTLSAVMDVCFTAHHALFFAMIPLLTGTCCCYLVGEGRPRLR